jgi:alpha/beta superfamily hydrolase
MKIRSLLFLTLFIGWFISLSLVVENVYKTQENFSEIDDFAFREDLVLTTEPGIEIAATLFIPKTLESSNPAVIIQHGMGGRKENMFGFALTFVNRGFVTLTCDLRGHGSSLGSSTFGSKESNDIVYAINYLFNNISGNMYNSQKLIISDIGLVGHSLGSLTVTLASYKSGVNSCVVLAPPAQLAGMFNEIIPISFEDLDDIVPTQLEINQELINELNLYNYSNRSSESPNPKNYLLIATENDGSVPHMVPISIKMRPNLTITLSYHMEINNMLI